MYPHRRVMLAALALSLSVGVLIAAAGFAAALWLTSVPPVDPPDNAPIRAVGIIIFVLAPASAVLSLVISTPLTYVLWNRGRPRFRSATLGCLLPAAGITVALLSSDSSLDSALLAGATLAVILVAATSIWWRLLPRPNSALLTDAYISPLRAHHGAAKRER